ncbi:hypothetical protein EYC80_001633 [Monilinia laxa]|uniref:Mid2 domain-containing protein n=1 Tax=Monilinia laxa TaxID=61186 RepID=A0A5N6K5M4_MONLA|nr:hypothetical protein EYC80_001633 [Monilinia laxa]
MSAFLILLSFSTVFRVTNAIPWAAAEQTATYKADEWSPRPTNTIPKARDLFKRGPIDVDICGWVGGNLAQPVGCGSGSSCIHDTSFGFVGCCPTSSAGADPIPCTDGLYTTCVDHNSAGYASNSFFVNNGVLSCSANSNCYKINYPQNYIQFGCGPSTLNATAATTFSGQATDLNLQIVYTGITFNPTITIQNPSNFGAVTLFSTSTIGSLTRSTASVVAGKGSLTASAPEPTSSEAAESKGSSNTGAIIGGIVGALVVITGCSVAAFLFIRKRGNERKSRVPRDAGSPERPSKETFESVPNSKPFPYAIHSAIPLRHPSPQPQNNYSQMSRTNNLGYAPVFQSPYHRPITPVGHDGPVEAPTPDLLAWNFRSPSPTIDPFQPPHSEILPESSEPSRPHDPPSSEPYYSSQSPESQNYYPQSPDLEHLHCYHSSSPEPQALRPRPSRSPPPLNILPTLVSTTNPYTLPPTTDLPPLDIMEDIQTPIVSKPSPANWHLALTGDRRTYAPTGGTSTSADHQHEPMTDIPALYADITTAMGAESMSSPNDTFLPRQNSDSTKPDTRRNFSRKGRAEKRGTENLNENETEEEDVRSDNIRQSGWVPSGLRTRNSPSPHSAPRIPDRRFQGNNEVPTQRDQLSDHLGEEVRIAYNPNNPHTGLNIEYWGRPRVVGIGRQLGPVIDPHAVEGGWL